MSTVVNTNVQALNSQRSLKIVSEQTGKASEKLSSGLRINRAGDDAAGLAISEKMRNQIKGLNQASRNSQDGISLIQTAEGALQESHDMLQRMRELVVQASNGTNTKDDRNKIALELNELSEEINSIADKTEFNTKKLINGDMTKETVVLQTGANENQTMGFKIESMNAKVLGVNSTQVGNLVSTGDSLEDVAGSAATTAKLIAGSGGVEIGDLDTHGTYDFGNGQFITLDKDSNVTIAGFGKNDGKYSKTEFEAKFKEDTEFYSESGIKVTVVANPTGSAVASITFDGAGAGSAATALNTTAASIKSKDTLSSKTINLLAIEGATLTGHTDKDSSLSHVSFSGLSNQQVAGVDSKIAEKIVAGEKVTLAELSGAVIISQDGTKTLTFDGAGAGTAKKNAKVVRHSADSGTATPETMGKILKRVDAAIEKVSSQRAKLGAYQNRLEHTIKNLDTSSENLSASESRVRDTDMAKEMMNFTRSNVLSQAAQSMLAQANQAPNNILSLLR